MPAPYIILATVAALLTTSNVVAAETEDKIIKRGETNGPAHLRRIDKVDSKADSIHEDRDGLFSLPEELEELVETHHHVREVFTRWCLEDKDPKEAEEQAKSKKEAQMAKLYKLYVTHPDNDRRKLEVKGLECDLLKKKDD
ncbi:putative secreted RxLR effector peptide protein [Phytophthora cinnamomi]|uniref:putative secreted RxLR effector peptide protein n=1 Tax=Phytophthora cinnamomi TaxID=4785 RepID=UPI00355976F0|nr:putative secreted RxLR effector peptide protein [Phytophthora cinnamomi]